MEAITERCYEYGQAIKGKIEFAVAVRTTIEAEEVRRVIEPFRENREIVPAIKAIRNLGITLTDAKDIINYLWFRDYPPQEVSNNE